MVLSTLKRYVRQLTTGATIKYNKDAKEYETIESARRSDMYLAAYYKRDTFESYTSFSSEVIEYNPRLYGYVCNIATANNIEVEDVISDLVINPYKIPDVYRSETLDRQRQYVLDNYVEINAYYRKLMGLPALDSSPDDIIIVSDDILDACGIVKTEDKYDMNSELYIHELTDDDLYLLELHGYLDKFQAEHPNLEYLKYLGSHRIHFLRARQARNFSILKIDKEDIPEDVYNTFIRIYEQCREYFTTCIYSMDLQHIDYEYYDRFIALCIMIMTIQRFVSYTFKFGIQREFYDWEFIQNLYSSYNVPFIEDLPIEHHVVLLKNLNNLLRHKSTDHVLLDICSLLGFTNVDIYKYYLVKTHKLDDDGNPIFKFKKIYKTDEHGEILKDDNGNPITEEVPDTQNMYDLYFQAVDIEDDNIILALQESAEGNRFDYNEVIEGDPYWWEDDDLTELKYSTAFNYIETKYLSLNLMYKMTEMLFEVSYAFRMIIDKKDEVDKFLLTIPKIIPDMSFNIFDIVIFMVALLCKRAGFTGNIISDPGLIAHIYGFDFTDETINEIKQLAESITDKSEREKLLSYFDDLTITSDDDISNLFAKIRDYNSYMIDKLRDTHDLDTYRLYKKIFTISMTEKNMDTMFSYTNEHGEDVIATSYKDYLDKMAPKLGGAVDSVDSDDIPTYLDHLISQVENFIDSLQYTFVINDTDNPLVTALISLIQFFKSYTVDLAGFNIIYLFDSKLYNLIKFIEHIESILVNHDLKDQLFQYYSDGIGKNIVNRVDNDKLVLYDSGQYKICIYQKDFLKFIDIIDRISVEYGLKDRLSQHYSDDISNVTAIRKDGDNIVLYDSGVVKLTLYGRELLKLLDEKKTTISIGLGLSDSLTQQYSDNIDKIQTMCTSIDHIAFNSDVHIDVCDDNMKDDSSIYVKDSHGSNIGMTIPDTTKFSYSDAVLNNIVKRQVRDKSRLRDELIIISE